MQHHYFQKKIPFDPTQGVKSVVKGKTFANMLLHATLPLICNMTIFRKKGFI